MPNPIALDFTHLHNTLAQASAEENKLQNQGQAVYKQQMALSQADTIAGNQDMQQAKVSNQDANAQTQMATREGQIMATTGASGKLYQLDLSGQQQKFGFNPQTLAHNQELQTQTIGEAKTAINQITNVMGGNRGLSASGVQAKVQEITTESNNMETQLGLTIQNEQQAATIASTQASAEASSQFKQEQNAQTSYTDAARQYANQAVSYTNAAQSEYNAATNYSIDASLTLLRFSNAMLNVANTALNANRSAEAKAQASEINSEASYQKAQTVYAQKTNTFNKQQDTYYIQAQKQAFSNYKIDLSAGLSNSKALKLSGYAS